VDPIGDPPATPWAKPACVARRERADAAGRVSSGQPGAPDEQLRLISLKLEWSP